jgi:DNA-directed RNA polymerase specialized sigma24 family protein
MGENQEDRDRLLARLASPRFFEAIRARLMDRLGLSQYVAENVASDAIDWAWQNLDVYDPGGLSLYNWVLQRALWRAFDYLKLPRSRFEQDAQDIAEVADTLPDPRDSIEAIASHRELENRVLAMLAETPQLLRLYKLRRAWNLSQKQIAANLGVTVKELKNLYEQLTRALKRINAALEEEATRS